MLQFEPVLRAERETQYAKAEFALNTASLLAILLDHCSRNSRDLFFPLLKAAVIEICDAIIDTASQQVDGLLRAVVAIENRVLQAECERIFVVELPLGNSLSVALLDRLLPGNPEIFRISLNRNDSSKRGYTRRDLIDSSFKNAGLTSKDIIVYIDEWKSGSNFYNLLKLIDSAAWPAAVLPVAVLTNSARSQDRFSKFSKLHNEIVEKHGFGSGEDWRFNLPALAGNPGEHPYFFWEDRDRLVGYRKMQFRGAILSGLLQGIEYIAGDKERFCQLLDIVQPSHPFVRRQVYEAGWSMFQQAYATYPEAKELLLQLDDESNSGAAEAPEIALQAVTEIISNFVNEHPSKFCFFIATGLLIQGIDTSPKDRYFLPGDVPVISDLVPNARLVRDTLVDKLVERLRAGACQ